MVSAHTYTFGHVYYGLPTPLRIYTLVIILNLFYFCIIYSILYILHTLIFKNTSFTLRLTVQNRSEILSKFAWTLASSQPSCFALIWIAWTHSCSHLLRIHSYSCTLNQIYLPTSDIPFTLTHPHSSYTPRTSEGLTLLSHNLDHFVLWCFIWFDSDLIGIVHISPWALTFMLLNSI